MTLAIQAINLVKTYGEERALGRRGRRRAAASDSIVAALRGVDLDVPKGRFTAIMGPSGSGKSTLLHLLAGLDTPTSGRVLLGDTDLTSCSEAELTALRRDRVGFVFQAFNLLPQLTAAQNIDLPARLANRRPDPAWRDQLIDLLGLAGRLNHRPAELSGGQQQRVALARALLGRPEVVFADEPTGNLDTATGREVLELLRRSVDELGQTVVMVTHDPTAASYADTVVLLRDGEIAGTLTDPQPEAVLAAVSTTAGVVS